MNRKPTEDTREHAQVAPRVPSRRRGCCLVTGLLAALVVCVGVAGVLVMTLVGEPNEIRMRVQAGQRTVASGDTVSIEITIENVDLEAVTITSVGVDDSLLDGFVVIDSNPPYRSTNTRDYPLLGAWHEYKIDQTLFGGDTLVVTLNAQAVRAGSYSGDVTVWVEGTVLGVPFERARRDTLDLIVQ